MGLFITLAGCGGSSAVDSVAEQSEGSQIALPVLANAGADREVLRGYQTRLDGSGTMHPRNESFAVSWEQLEGPQVFLSNAADLAPTFVAPLDPSVLVFRLTVDDGRHITSDEVTLFVRTRPELVAPRVRAGADRYVGYGSDAVPLSTDLVQVIPQDATVTWEEVAVTTSSGGDARAKEALLPVYFRVVAEQDGLRSAPDYIALWPFDAERYGAVAPTGAVTAPLVVEPGQTITLDASASGDANADTLSYRWVQLRGGATFATTPRGALAEAAAPAQLQELVFRLFVSDGLLESAPVDAVVVVSAPEGVSLPALAPLDELLAHPGNLVRIDAAGSLSLGLAAASGEESQSEVLYTFTQTAGPPTNTLTQAGHDAVLVFPAPTLSEGSERAEVAYSVVASVGDILTEPVVIRVTILPPSDNQAPSIVFCAPGGDHLAGETLVITALLSDPENDSIESLTWTPSAGEVVASELQYEGCAPSYADMNEAAAPWRSVSFKLPDPKESQVTLELEACDALAACTKSNLVF